MSDLTKWLASFLANPVNPIGIVACALTILLAVVFWEYTRFMLKSLRRNLLRSILTGLATSALVLMVTLTLSVLFFINDVTSEKSKNLKSIVTERWQIPSQMPRSYGPVLSHFVPNPDQDSMTWQFYGGTIDPDHRTRENMIFFFCMEPKKVISFDKNGNLVTMMDGIDEFSKDEQRLLDTGCKLMTDGEEIPEERVRLINPELARREAFVNNKGERVVRGNRKYVVIGVDRLEAMKKKVGEKITITSLNYPGIDLEVEIMAAFPPGRYDGSAVMNCDYLNQALDNYKNQKGVAHSMADKSLNLVWLRMPDTRTFEKISNDIMTSEQFLTPAVKCETASSGIASFLDAYRDILWGMQWLLIPSLLVSMAMVIAIAISISVRERRTEMAVLKVLGFTPNMVLALILGEALVIGVTFGLVSAFLTKFVINEVVGGFKFPIAFFPSFKIFQTAPWWGLGMGALTALVGSLVPAWSARSVKVSEVFSKIA